MHVTSPYGKPVVEELTKVYGLNGPDEAADFIQQHVAEHYKLRDVIIEGLEVAYGLSAKIKTPDERLYLKFTSRCIHGDPEQLFPWLEFAREHDVPIPEILRSINDDWFTAPLRNSDYDVVYLMREIPGAPMPTAGTNEIAQYVDAMAHFHQVGATYPHSVKGRSATWNSKRKHRQSLWQQAEQETVLSRSLLDRAKEVVEQTQDSELTKTIVHGDLRFCHVFFDNGKITGLIDVDTSTTGEPWIDYCAGLLSGNSPERGNLVSFDQLRQAMAHYHQRLPLSPSDQSALTATFAFAAVETLYDLAQSAKAGTTQKDDIESVESLLDDILQSSLLE